MIAAILRAQLLSLRFRSGRGYSGAIFSAITSLFFYGMWAFFAWVAVLFLSEPRSTPYMMPGLAGGLLFVMGYWQLAPVVSASFGASLDMRKLLVYPIPRGQLFIAEVVLRITTCAEMIILICGAVIGLLRNPLFGLRAAPAMITGALLFTAMNILLSAGTRNMIERLFIRTRLRELMVLVFVLISVAPRYLIGSHVDPTRAMRLAPSQMYWPWGAAAHVFLGVTPIPAAAALVLWFLAAAIFSRWQFEKSIRYDATSLKVVEKQTGKGQWADTVFRLPGRFLLDPVAALAEKELRTMARIPRFRVVYAMSCFLQVPVPGNAACNLDQPCAGFGASSARYLSRMRRQRNLRRALSGIQTAIARVAGER